MEHVLYETGDKDAPESIKDSNGEVVLGLCRKCWRGEIELAEPCGPRQPAADKKYKSCAEWPDHVFTAPDGSHVSSDSHYTRAEAEGVCSMLGRFGFGGRGPLPIRVWVEPPQGIQP